MKEYCTKLFSTLKRWKCTCTDECASGDNPKCTCENLECYCRERKLNSNLWRIKYVRNFYFINYSNVASSKIL